MGALAVISNLPKTVVMYLLEYLLEKHGYQGIAKVTSRPAGPELAPNQVGEDELMPFPVLDACFHLFAGEKLSPSEVLLALEPMFPERPRRPAGGAGRRSSSSSSPRASTSGCSRRSRSTSATSTSTASGRSSCRW